MKGDGGAIGITEDPSALRRWVVSVPEGSHLVSGFLESASELKVSSEDDKHHEQPVSEVLQKPGPEVVLCDEGSGEPFSGGVQTPSNVGHKNDCTS